MLHKLNPVRLGYIRDQIDRHWSVDERSRRPLEGKSALVLDRVGRHEGQVKLDGEKLVVVPLNID